MAKNTHDQLEEKMNDALALKKDGEPGKRADITEAVGVLKEIVDEIVTDTAKFDGENKMNKTAGTRVRKYLMLVKKSTTNLRKAVQNKKSKED